MTMVAIDPLAGWLKDIRRVPSPNCDERPAGTDISLIVVHGISVPPGEYGGPWIDQMFTNRLDPTVHPHFIEIKEQRVSAHVLIRRDGELVQYVAFPARAWHAGPSRFCGQEACNDFSVGIELEGSDNDAYTDIQYQQLADLVLALRRVYPSIPADHVVGHCDIAPGRKTDPGPGFSWPRFWDLLEKRQHT